MNNLKPAHNKYRSRLLKCVYEIRTVLQGEKIPGKITVLIPITRMRRTFRYKFID